MEKPSVSGEAWSVEEGPSFPLAYPFPFPLLGRASMLRDLLSRTVEGWGAGRATARGKEGDDRLRGWGNPAGEEEVEGYRRHRK